MHLGMAVIQLSSIIGAYAALVANAHVIFPKCSQYSVIDYLFGLSTKTGFLCEATSLCLWTFPLMCCMMIPFLEYWDFCDSRLYYECLRAKMLINFPDKDMIQSPMFYWILAILMFGIMTVL